mgnify:FL=1
MKRNAYVKNQIRIIKKTKARFLSIFCIVFLGASFFAGLRQSPLIMKESMHDYLQTYKWNDLNYIATYGFDESIIQKVEKVKVTAAIKDKITLIILLIKSPQSHFSINKQYCQ